MGSSSPSLSPWISGPLGHARVKPHVQDVGDNLAIQPPSLDVSDISTSIPHAVNYPQWQEKPSSADVGDKFDALPQHRDALPQWYATDLSRSNSELVIPFCAGASVGVSCSAESLSDPGADVLQQSRSLPSVRPPRASRRRELARMKRFILKKQSLESLGSSRSGEESYGETDSTLSLSSVDSLSSEFSGENKLYSGSADVSLAHGKDPYHTGEKPYEYPVGVSCTKVSHNVFSVENPRDHN